MIRDQASQTIGAQLVSASDGSAFTGSVTCYVTVDGGTQAIGSVGSGACTHEGNGFHTYQPSAEETDGAHVAFTFVGSGAVPVTVQVYPSYPQTGDAFARLGAPAGASIAADIAALPTDADVNAQVDAALADYDAPTKAELDAAVAPLATSTALATVDSNVDAIKVTTDKLDDTLEDQGEGTYGFTEASLVEAPTGGSAPTAGEIADAVWDEDLSTHTTEGSAGDTLGSVATGTPPTAQAIREEIDANSTKLASIEADTQDLQTQVGAAGAGLTALGDTRIANLDAAVSTRASQASVDTVDGVVDAILLDTAAIDGRLPSDPADQSLIIAATNAIVADTEDIQAKIGTPAGASLAADIAALPDSTAVQTAAAAALTAYDPPTRAEATSDKAEVLAAIPSAEDNAEALATAAAADPLSVNVKEINDAALEGDGSEGSPWGPA